MIDTDFWIIASPDLVADMAQWLTDNVVEPRFAIHESGQAIAVAFSNTVDETMFAIRVPNDGPHHRYRR